MYWQYCKYISDVANTCNIAYASLKFWPILITFDYNREKGETFGVCFGFATFIRMREELMFLKGDM